MSDILGVVPGLNAVIARMKTLGAGGRPDQTLTPPKPLTKAELLLTLREWAAATVGMAEMLEAKVDPTSRAELAVTCAQGARVMVQSITGIHRRAEVTQIVEPASPPPPVRQTMAPKK